MIDSLISYLRPYGIAPSVSVPVATLVAAAVALLVIVGVEVIVKKVLLRFIHRFAKKSATRFDDLLVKHRVFSAFAMMSPPVLLHLMARSVLQYYPAAVPVVEDISVLYLAVVILFALFFSLDALQDFLSEGHAGRRIPVKSFIQVVKTVIVFLGLIFIVAKLLGKSPLVFFSGLGAFTAVLVLVFKDSILGFVAGLQLSGNDLVRPGDWIEMQKYGADGTVVDMSLVTVSVQNSDKSIVTIPAYALISEGFKNWRGMDEAGGRRIKRAIRIDMTSIRFLDDELMRQMEGIRLLEGYLAEKKAEIEAYNRQLQVDPASPVNARRMTNLGTFRAYLTAYIRQLPKINPDMVIVVRYLQSEGMGLPFEIYCFSTDREFPAFEALQSDIMDHVLAVLPHFGLRVFQLH